MMDVVNKQDEVIGQATREEIIRQKLIHRITHVWVFRTDGRLVLHKRAASRAYCPLHWSMAAGGGVDAGETYEQAAKRELKEELGVEAELTFLTKEYFVDPDGVPKFEASFRAVHDGPFPFDSDEVAEVISISLEETRAMIARGEPFLSRVVDFLDRFTT